MVTKDFSRQARGVSSGVIAGTLVEASRGWMRVEDLRIGDAVHSYDGGLARVLGLDREWIMPIGGEHTLHLPGGSFDNCSDMLMLPGQNLLVDTLGDAAFPDDLVVLIPAAALEGVCGATPIRLEKPLEVITPRFAEDEAIYANSGTLLHCPGIRHVAGASASAFFTQLDLAQSAALMQRIRGAASVQPQVRRAA